MTVPGPEIRRVQEAAAAADVGLAFSVNEINGSGSGSTLYNTIVYIDRDGHLLGKHRKMIPTTGERLVWAQGDGSDLQVHDFGFAQVAGLVCWENYMPLARYTLNARGAEVHVAPTWDRGGPWVTSMQHIAKEGRCYVVGCAPRMELSDIPDSMPYKQDYLASAGDRISSRRIRHCRSRWKDYCRPPTQRRGLSNSRSTSGGHSRIAISARHGRSLCSTRRI